MRSQQGSTSSTTEGNADAALRTLSAEGLDSHRQIRRDHRTRAIYRVARFRLGDDEGLARIRNISDHGVGLTLNLPVAVGDVLAVDFDEELTVECEIVWVGEGTCGTSFAQAIDSAALLTEIADNTNAGLSRPLRLEIHSIVTIESELGLRVAHARNISQWGMRLHHQGIFPEGMELKVRMSNGLKKRGIVRWARTGCCGIKLLEPVSVEFLVSRKKLDMG